jgi:DNA mismatch repair protein MutS
MSKTDVSSNNIMNEYIELTRTYTKQYGVKTVVLLQVGSFFEIYGLKSHSDGEITQSCIEEISRICNLNVSEKKITYQNSQVVMAGFRDYTLEKYLQKITENGYSAVVYVQEKDGKNIKRVFQGVYSTGSYISYETDTSSQITNNTMCIWIETFTPLERNSSQNTLSKIRETIVYGVATANIYTGKSSLFEYQTPFYLNPTTFDELERYVSVFEPSEIIIISPFEEKINNNILQFIGIKSQSIHIVNLRKTDDNEKVLNCAKQKYIKHILTTFFGEESVNVCSEFDTHSIATQAFCYLMNFLQEHNPHLVRKIAIPTFNNTSDRMILANHTLKQLNIIDDFSLDSKRNAQLSSVLSFLNKYSYIIIIILIIIL